MKYALLFVTLISPFNLLAQSTHPFDIDMAITHVDIQKIENKMNSEYKRGKEALQNARDRFHTFAWPDKDDLRVIFLAAIASLQTKSSPAKLITFVVTVLAEFTWGYTEDYFGYIEHFYEAKYAFENAEFYRDILIQLGQKVPQFDDISYLLWFDEDDCW